MNIGIFGGAFDPIHFGHVSVVQRLADLFDEIWIMPCWSHSYGKNMTTPETRVKMANAAFGCLNNDKIKVNRYEIDNRICGGTIVLVERLLKDFPEHKFSFIVGQDNADTIHKWIETERLRKLISFVVVPRTGYEGTQTWYLEPPHQTIDHLYVSLPAICSTDIRNNVEGMKEFLSPEVLQIIHEEGLYLTTHEKIDLT